MNHKNVVQKLQLIEKRICDISEDIKTLPEGVDVFEYIEGKVPYINWDLFKKYMENLKRDEEFRTIKFKIFKDNLDLHELLCKSIYEHDEESLKILDNNVIDFKEI